MQLISAKNGQQYLFRRLVAEDADALSLFFSKLSEETKAKFQPHPLGRAYTAHMCNHLNEKADVFVLADFDNRIVGYFLLDYHTIAHERARYQNYQIVLEPNKTVFFAPCIEDRLQNSGLASAAMPLIINYSKKKNLKQIILLGGTQESNTIGIAFYKKHGFIKVGAYQSHVWNIDMMLTLSH